MFNDSKEKISAFLRQYEGGGGHIGLVAIALYSYVEGRVFEYVEGRVFEYVRMLLLQIMSVQAPVRTC